MATLNRHSRRDFIKLIGYGGVTLAVSHKAALATAGLRTGRIIDPGKKMNIACANKLLKIIEEPPNKTVFILIAEDEERLISTIKSRCQILHFPPLSEHVLKQALLNKYGLEENVASKIAHQANGNFNKASDLVFQLL